MAEEGFFFLFVGIQDRKCTRGKQTTQRDNKTKQQQNTNAAPLFLFIFFTLWFPPQMHTPSMWNATGSEWGIHKEESLTPSIKHDGVLMSPSLFHSQRHAEQTTGVKVRRQRNNFDLRAQHQGQTSNGHMRGRAFSRWGFPPMDPFQRKTRFKV